jgi:hypothetical protein
MNRRSVRLSVCQAICVILAEVLWLGPITATEPAASEWKYRADLLRPFWQGTVMHGESVLFIKDDVTGESHAAVLFPILELPIVQDSTGTISEKSNFQLVRESLHDRFRNCDDRRNRKNTN